jgi:hypothetical protein
MASPLERLRSALTAESEPTLASIGGPDAVAEAARDLAGAAEFPFVVALLSAEWEALPDRGAFISLIVDGVARAAPYELDDVLDVVLSEQPMVADLATQLVAPLRARAAGDDAVAGIALEAWLRLGLGGWTRPIPLLHQLDEHAAATAEAEPASVDPTFLHRLVRCLGAAGEHWRAHGSEIAEALRGLLPHTAVDDDVAFELAMMELHAGLEEADPAKSLRSLTQARTYLALCAQYEHRIDAELFGAGIDALVTFAQGAVPTTAELERLKALVFEFRLYSLSDDPHWRHPRADTSLQWLDLVDTLTRLQGLDRSWLHAGELLNRMAGAYRAHRTLALLQQADVVRQTSTDKPQTGHAALPTLLQPRLVQAVANQAGGLELLDEWLSVVEQTEANGDDIAAIRDIRAGLSTEGPPLAPKGPSVDVSALTGLLALPQADASAVEVALGAHPALARKLNSLALARNTTDKAAVSIYFQEQFEKITRTLHQSSGLSGERALRVEQVAHALLLYMQWIGSVTSGSKLAASYQRSFTDESDAPKEGEFADDLHRFLAMNLPTVPEKEVSNIANGRVDLICHFGSTSLVIECKRELHDASLGHLASLYAFQAAEYNWADPGVGFLAVMDLTSQTRRIPLGEAVRVVTVPPAEPNGLMETVMVVKVQANLPSPSYQSTPAAARARAAAGVQISQVPVT